jgi:hypothetical protein
MASFLKIAKHWVQFVFEAFEPLNLFAKGQFELTKKSACKLKKTSFYVEDGCCAQAATVHCKKRFAIFPSPAGMSLNQLYLAGRNWGRENR